MHVAAWEDALLARLAGRPTHEALGLDEATLAKDEDTQNAAIFALHRHRPLADVRNAADPAIERRVPGSPPSPIAPSRARWRTSFRPVQRAMAGPPRRGSRATRGSTRTHPSWIRALVDRR